MDKKPGLTPVLGLVFLALAAWAACSPAGGTREGAGGGRDAAGVGSGPTGQQYEAKKNLTLYFADSMSQHVMPEERAVAAGGRPLPEVAMEELLKGPRDPFLRRGIPEGISVRGVSLDQASGVAGVDFARNVVERFPQGSAGAAMFMVSLIYTLTDLPGVSAVRILVEGREVEVLGELAVNEPARRGGIKTYPVFPDRERARWLQQKVKEGQEAWRLDPLEVARREGRMAGFQLGDRFVLISPREQDGAGVARVEATHEGKTYLITLFQPALSGNGGIWAIQSVKER